MCSLLLRHCGLATAILILTPALVDAAVEVGERGVSTVPAVDHQPTLDTAPSFAGPVLQTPVTAGHFVYGAALSTVHDIDLQSKMSTACSDATSNVTLQLRLADLSGRRSWDTGNFDGCLSAGGQHCLLRVGGDVGGAVPLGVCVPRACTTDDWGALNVSAPGPLWNWAFFMAPILYITMEAEPSMPIAITCGDHAVAWDGASIAAVTGLSLVVGVVVLATIADVTGFMAPDATADENNKPVDDRASMWLNVCRSLSLHTSLKALFQRRRALEAGAAVDLAPLDGVRALSAQLVVLGHTAYIYQQAGPGFFNFGPNLAQILGSVAGQAIPSAEFAVDSFFLLSGAAGAYVGVKKLLKAYPMLSSSANNWACYKRKQAADTVDSNSAATLLLLSESDNAAHPRAGTKSVPVTAVGVSWLSAIIQRWLRLVPLVVASLILMMWVLPLLGSGPYWFSVEARLVTPCQGVNFLYNVLFIQNFVPDAVAGNFNQECAAWMWYLAVDFQLHLLLPGVMIAYVINSRMGWAVVVALFTISFGTSIWLVDNHNLSSQVLKATTGLHGNYQDEFYTKPHTRAPALLLGVALAVSLLMREQHGPAALQSMAPALHSGLSRAAQLARWILPSTVNTTGATLKHQTPDLIATSTLVATMSLLGFLYYIPVTNYSADNATGWSRSAAITYTILSRPAWAAALAVFLYLCCTKRGGALGWLLSLQIWLPLSRLAFALYLAHPIVIFYFMGSEVAPARYAAAWVASAYTRNLLVTYVLAALLYLFVEAPAAALLRNVSQSVARTGTGAGTASSKRVVSRGINY